LGKFKPLPIETAFGGECTACGCGLSPVRDTFNATAWATYRPKWGCWDDLPVTFVEAPSLDQTTSETSTNAPSTPADGSGAAAD